MQLIFFKLKLDWMSDICSKLSCDTFLKQLSWRGTKRVSSRKSLILSQQSCFLSQFIYLCGKQRIHIVELTDHPMGILYAKCFFIFMYSIYNFSAARVSQCNGFSSSNNRSCQCLAKNRARSIKRSFHFLARRTPVKGNIIWRTGAQHWFPLICMMINLGHLSKD